jgi:hypothetical protein
VGGNQNLKPASTSEEAESRRFAVLEFKDNRLQGLLREVRQAIEDCEDPETLRRFGVTLKLLGDESRCKAWSENPKVNKAW